MKRLFRRAIGFGLLGLAAGGCAMMPKARYVYQDGEYGVVAIPVNTFLEKEDFRAQAEVLMAQHFPEGYEIVRAEEVEQGQRTLDLGKKTELDTEPNLTALNQMIKLGKLARTTSFEERDSVQIRECRIIYKRKSAGTPGSSGQFTAMANLSPPFYIDPNELMRKQCKAELATRIPPPAKPNSGSNFEKAHYDPFK